MIYNELKYQQLQITQNRPLTSAGKLGKRPAIAGVQRYIPTSRSTQLSLLPYMSLTGDDKQKG